MGEASSLPDPEFEPPRRVQIQSGRCHRPRFTHGSAGSFVSTSPRICTANFLAGGAENETRLSRIARRRAIRLRLRAMRFGGQVGKASCYGGQVSNE
jgi:hypothetical protein